MRPAADAIRLLIADDHLLFRSGDVALRGGVPAGRGIVPGDGRRCLS